jgi:hypothetical protein
MRASTLTMILFASACSSAREPTTTPTPPTTPAPLRASIDGHPFVARSALMTEVNAKAHLAADPDGHEVTVSTIYVFERVVTCGDLAHVGDRHRLTLADDEHAIQIDVMGAWPRSRAVLATSKDVDAAVQTGTSRTDVQGTVTILEATPTSGVISLDLQNPYSNDGAHGGVRVTVCR